MSRAGPPRSREPFRVDESDEIPPAGRQGRRARLLQTLTGRFEVAELGVGSGELEEIDRRLRRRRHQAGLQVRQPRAGNLDERNYGPLNNDRRHNLSLSSRLEIPKTGGVTVSAVARIMSGSPFTIHDTTFDLDQNGVFFDPLPAGTYDGTGKNAVSIESDGGRNGAYFQLDMRVGYRARMTDARTLDVFFEVFNLTDEPNFANPSGDLRNASTFLRTLDLRGGGFPRSGQFGLRLGF